MNIRQEKLKKLAMELKCLKLWRDRGMVPKEEMEEHLANIDDINAKILEEKERAKVAQESISDFSYKLDSLSDSESGSSDIFSEDTEKSYDDSDLNLTSCFSDKDRDDDRFDDSKYESESDEDDYNYIDRDKYRGLFSDSSGWSDSFGLDSNDM